MNSKISIDVNNALYANRAIVQEQLANTDLRFMCNISFALLMNDDFDFKVLIENNIETILQRNFLQYINDTNLLNFIFSLVAKNDVFIQKYGDQFLKYAYFSKNSNLNWIIVRYKNFIQDYTDLKYPSEIHHDILLKNSFWKLNLRMKIIYIKSKWYRFKCKKGL